VRSAVLDALKILMSNIEGFCPRGKTPINGLVMLAGRLVSNNAEEIPYYV
jgi:hypothetical protein